MKKIRCKKQHLFCTNVNKKKSKNHHLTKVLLLIYKYKNETPSNIVVKHLNSKLT